MQMPNESALVPHTRRSVRVFLVLLGMLFTGIGVAGIALPLLPGMPFLILAAGCFARSNDRCYRWLLEHRIMGPPLHAWREHRQIPRWVKPRAIVAVVIAFGLSSWLALDVTWMRVLWMTFGLGVCVFIARLPAYEASKAGKEL
jgi:uncharacterized protein